MDKINYAHRSGVVANCEALEAKYTKQLELLSSFERAKGALTVAVNKQSNLKASLESVTKQLTHSQETVRNEQQILADAEQAQRVLNRLNELKLEAATVQTIMSEKKSHLSSLYELLRQINQSKNQEKLRGYIDLLSEVRSLTHRNSIPHVIGKRFLSQLLVQINDYLVQFDAPFKVAIDDILGLRALMNSGAAVSACCTTISTERCNPTECVCDPSVLHCLVAIR